MQVTILGAGTGVCAPGYSPAGMYVRAGREHVLLDAGAGTLQRLHRLGVTFLELDRLFLTHFHPDHCLDLASLLFAMRIPQPARTRPFHVYGPPGLTRLYQALDRAFGGALAPRTYRLRLHDITGRARLAGRGFTVTAKPMRHSAPCFGYRVDAGGRSLAYSGDTDACPAVIALGQGVDCLILECSVTDERKVAGHLTPSECGRIAAAARCRRLVLTHFYPVFARYDILARVRRAYRGPVVLARDGTRLRV